MLTGSMDLPAELRRVRKNFDQELARTLQERTDLTLREIAEQFGVSNKVIQRVTREFGIKPRRARANGEQRVRVPSKAAKRRASAIFLCGAVEN